MTILKLKTILIIEDDLDISFAVSSFLQGEGYQVQIAENGFVALELIKKNGVPNLVLLDMMMPVMNGWQFATEFAAQFDNSSPIIVMTAAADAEQRAKDIGATGWIEKPFGFSKLIALIKKFES
ncbi:MAG: response regulator transcription factor [Bacteriovorax sp.]|nr:response regulator transcription factor [Bacteriovorax sp.]